MTRIVVFIDFGAERFWFGPPKGVATLECGHAVNLTRAQAKVFRAQPAGSRLMLVCQACERGEAA